MVLVVHRDRDKILSEGTLSQYSVVVLRPVLSGDTTAAHRQRDKKVSCGDTRAHTKLPTFVPRCLARKGALFFEFKI
jgi:hypothetical protein